MGGITSEVEHPELCDTRTPSAYTNNFFLKLQHILSYIFLRQEKGRKEGPVVQKRLPILLIEQHLKSRHVVLIQLLK